MEVLLGLRREVEMLRREVREMRETMPRGPERRDDDFRPEPGRDGLREGPPSRPEPRDPFGGQPPRRPEVRERPQPERRDRDAEAREERPAPREDSEERPERSAAEAGKEETRDEAPAEKARGTELIQLQITPGNKLMVGDKVIEMEQLGKFLQQQRPELLEVRAASETDYETVKLVIQSAQKSGVKKFRFAVVD